MQQAERKPATVAAATLKGVVALAKPENDTPQTKSAAPAFGMLDAASKQIESHRELGAPANFPDTESNQRSIDSKPTSAGPNPSAPTNASFEQMAQGMCMRLLVDGHVRAFAELFTLLDMSGSPRIVENTLSSQVKDHRKAYDAASNDKQDPQKVATPSLTTLHLQRLAKLLATREVAGLRAHQNHQASLQAKLLTIPVPVPDPRNDDFTKSQINTRALHSAAAIAEVYSATRNLAQYVAQIMPEEKSLGVEYAHAALQAAQILGEATASELEGKSGSQQALTFPAILDSHVTLADAMAQQGEWSSAIKYYKLALVLPEAVEKMVVVAHALAFQMEQEQNWPDACNVYDDILRSIPVDHPAAGSLAMDVRRRKGHAMLERGFMDNARELIQDYLNWATRDEPSKQAAIAAALGRQAPPSGQAIKQDTVMQRVRATADDEADPLGAAYIDLARAYENMDKLDLAVNTLLEYLKPKTEPEKEFNTEAIVQPSHMSVATLEYRHQAQIKLGNLLNRLGRNDEAAQCLNNSQDVASSVQLGIARACVALPQFIEAINKSPKNVMTFFHSTVEQDA